jgi:hypothetical protein
MASLSTEQQQHTSPNLMGQNIPHSSQVPKAELPPSLLREESNSVAISFINVPTATVVADEFTVFTINVTERRTRSSAGALQEVERFGGDNWIVMKRYSSMRRFHQKIRKSFVHTRGPAPKGASTEEFSKPLPPFPPTKWFGNRAPKFVEQRREALNNYFTSLLMWTAVGETADLRMRLLREYLTFSDPEIAAHRMFRGVQHGPRQIPRSPQETKSTQEDGSGTTAWGVPSTFTSTV